MCVSGSGVAASMGRGRKLERRSDRTPAHLRSPPHRRRVLARDLRDLLSARGAAEPSLDDGPCAKARSLRTSGAHAARMRHGEQRPLPIAALAIAVLPPAALAVTRARRAPPTRPRREGGPPHRRPVAARAERTTRSARAAGHWSQSSGVPPRGCTLRTTSGAIAGPAWEAVVRSGRGPHTEVVM